MADRDPFRQVPPTDQDRVAGSRAFESPLLDGSVYRYGMDPFLPGGHLGGDDFIDWVSVYSVCEFSQLSLLSVNDLVGHADVPVAPSSIQKLRNPARCGSRDPDVEEHQPLLPNAHVVTAFRLFDLPVRSP